MERGTEEATEHGPGVGVSIGRHTRVRPLLRFEAEMPPLCKGRWQPEGLTEGLSILRIKVVPRSIFFRPCYARTIF